MEGYPLSLESYNRSSSEEDCQVYHACPHGVAFSPDARTVVSEWALVCDRAWILPSIMFYEMIGLAFGATCSGPLGDRFGRRTTLLIMLALALASNIVIYFSNTWIMFSAFRFFSMLGSGGIITVHSLYLQEITPAKWRVFCVSFPCSQLGFAFYSTIVFVCKDWRQAQVVIIVINVLAFFSTLSIPESLRWLVVHGDMEKAKIVVKRFCKYNKKPIPIETELNFISSEGGKSETKRNTLLLFRRPFLKNIVFVCTIMALISLSCYGIFFGVKNFHGNFYINMILFSLVVVPFSPLTPILGHKAGRRGGNLILLGLTSLLSCTAIVVEFTVDDVDTRGWIITAIGFAMFVCLEQAWAIHISLTAETFPTSMRASAFALLQTCGRAGGALAPFVIPRSSDTVYEFYAISAVLLFICFFVLMFGLQETRKRPMNDTMAQEIGTHRQTLLITQPEQNTPTNKEVRQGQGQV